MASQSNNSQFQIGVSTTQAIQAVQQLQAALNGLQQQASGINLASGLGGGVSGIAGAVSGIKGLIATVAAATATVAGFGVAFKKAIDIKAEQESAKLGIKALLASMYEFRDKSGKILTGNDKLKAAGDEAKKQLDAIRLAGLKTAATGQEIQEAFKVALGTGSIAGLDPDQINKVTLGLIQAGKALSIKGSDALSSEIRAVLSGEQIDNSSIAKALQLSGTQIKDLIEQGKLYDVLNEKLKVYGDLADETSATFEVMASNVGEAYDLVLTKAIDQGAFDTLKTSLASIPKALLDENGNIRKEYQGIVNFIGGAFQVAATVISGLIDSVLVLSAKFSAFLDENSTQLSEIGDNFSLVWGSVKDLVSSVLSLFGVYVSTTADGVVKTGLLAETLGLVAKAVAFVSDAFNVVAGSVTFLVGKITGSLLGAVRSVAQAFDKVFGTNLAAGVDALTVSAKKLAEAGKDTATSGLAGEAQKNLDFLKLEIEKQNKLAEIKKRNAAADKAANDNKDYNVDNKDNKDNKNKEKKAKDLTSAINAINDAQAKLDLAREAASFDAFKSNIELKKQELQKLLAFNLVSKEEALKKENALDVEQLNKEKELAQAKVAALKEQLAKTSPKSVKEILGLNAELVTAEQKVSEFTSKERLLSIKLDIDLEGVRQKTADMLSSINRDILGLTGQTLEQSIQEINSNLATSLRDELVIGNADLQKALQERAQLQINAAMASESQKQASLASSFMSVRSDSIDLQYERGLISFTEKEDKLKAIREETIAALQKQYQILKDMSELNPGNLDLSLQVEQAGLEIDKLKAKSEDSDSVFKNLGGSIKSFFSDIAEGSKSLSQSIQALFKSLADGIMNNIIDKLAKQATDVLGNLFAGAASGGSGGGAGVLASIGDMLGFAGGGSVTGAGTGTSDSIPAWLSNGEFVIKAASVKKLGVGFLNHLNQTASIPRFAAGGLVGGLAGGGDTTVNASFNPTLRIMQSELESALFSSPRFEKNVINIYNANRNKLR